MYPRRVTSLPEHLSARPVGREKLPRETLAEHQRARILDNAIGVFAKRGYRATTIQHLVTASKSSIGNFYALFEGKEECFLELYDRLVTEGNQQIASACRDAGDWAEEALSGLQALLELFDREPLKARIVLAEVKTAGLTARSRYDATIDRAVEWLGGARSVYPDARELPATFEQAAVGGVAWFLQQRIESSAHESTAELFVDTTQLLLEPILGDRELARRRAKLRSLA
jgi:AcrR family transcriptional regulator